MQGGDQTNRIACGVVQRQQKIVMKIIKTKNGIDYLIEILKDKARTVTRAAFWKIPHHTQEEDVRLKIWRSTKTSGPTDILERGTPKSKLTLDNDEFKALLNFIEKNYEPFKQGVKHYLPIDQKFDPKSLEHLKAIFDNPDKKQVLDFIATHSILPDELIMGLQTQARIKAVNEFEMMLNQNLVEQKWQAWFTKNDWVLGSEFVRILDERKIDTANIADYLMEAYDGFLDIIEIKRPDNSLKFWADVLDHDNYVPSTDIIKAITQATTYIYEVEREANSVKFLERVGNVKTIKPRCILIFGRSYNWNDAQKAAYRILNSSYHNLTIMTYDHVLDRAKRILEIDEGLEPF